MGAARGGTWRKRCRLRVRDDALRTPIDIAAVGASLPSAFVSWLIAERGPMKQSSSPIAIVCYFAPSPLFLVLPGKGGLVLSRMRQPG